MGVYVVGNLLLNLNFMSKQNKKITVDGILMYNCYTAQIQQNSEVLIIFLS